MLKQYSLEPSQKPSVIMQPLDLPSLSRGRGGYRRGMEGRGIEGRGMEGKGGEGKGGEGKGGEGNGGVGEGEGEEVGGIQNKQTVSLISNS